MESPRPARCKSGRRASRVGESPRGERWIGAFETGEVKTAPAATFGAGRNTRESGCSGPWSSFDGVDRAGPGRVTRFAGVCGRDGRGVFALSLAGVLFVIGV